MNELGKLVGTLAGLAAATVSLKLIATGFEIFVVEKELEEMMGKEWVEACISDESCFKTLMKVAEESLERMAKTPEKEVEEKMREGVDLNTCLAKAKQFISNHYNEIKKYGVPAILLFVNEDGTVNEVRVVAYFHGDMAFEWDICPEW